SFLEFLDQVRKTVIDGIAHQDFPFPLLVERLQPPRDVSRSPVFQVAFGWDKPRRLSTQGGEPADEGHTADPAGLGLEPFALGQQGAAFDMMLMMLNMGNSLSAALQYNSDLFDQSTVARFVAHFQTLLNSIVANPNQALAELPLLDHAERKLMLDEWNTTARDYPRDRCLHELFQAQVSQNPHAVAVTSGDQQMTYQQLDQRANQLARHLAQLGAGPQNLVAICIPRSVDMLVGILGILKSGAAYVPLAPDTPHDRMTFMLQQSQAPVLLTQASLADDLPPHATQLVRIDDDWPTIAQHSTAALGPTAEATDLAYVIFTSGSTGKPKGVQLEHRSVVNFLNSMRHQPGMGPQDTLLAVTTLTFDISVLELFLPLSVGGQVIIVEEKVACDGGKLAKLLSQSPATIMQATPATWRLLVEAGWPGDPQLKVLCGGEALPRDLAEQLLQRCASLWNMYGPTETTIWSAVDRVQSGDGLLPIGRPIDNTQIYILDSRLQPVPIGVAGDLFIGGDGLARGYLHRPQLTAERFVPNPFSTQAATRMYKTGDIARYRTDGNIEFLGRSDFQVKIRGFRIELGEIEANLNQHPAVGQAVVMARQTGPREDDKQLVAYLVPAAETQPNTTQLREHLRQELPDYMLPATFLWLDRFPLNPAGKINRQALPEPDTSRPELESAYVPPRNDNEQTLAQIWADVLGLEKVGVHDNFFDLGGASIQSLEIGAIAEREGLKITPTMLFQHPTIAELAAAAPQVASPAPPTATESKGNGSVVAAVSPAEPTAPQTAARPKPKRRRRTEKANTIIESLGVYLPPKEVTTKELVKGCKHKMWFPLERMTGIHSRRMAGEDEFSIDLAIKAVDECFRHSKYTADDIDVVIACNITRLDKLRTLSIEPNTSLQLKKHFGFKHALAFDVTNACTGMLTAVQVVDAMLTTGLIRRGLVVSGEFISDIARTAQLEIDGFMDPRIACLTVGDAGAAVLLESATSRDVGFHELDMYSLSKYSRMCIGRLTEYPHGGIIMHVPDPMEHTAVAVQHSVMHAQYMFDTSEWSPEQMDHLIMHQTSDRSLRDAKRAINKAFKKKICTDANTIHNIAERGNTATTTHFVAIWDNILNGTLKSHEHVLLGITGSGQTIGTGIYTFDDLPERIRASKQEERHPPKVPAVTSQPPRPRTDLPRIQVASVGTIPLSQQAPRDTTKMTAMAARECLRKSSYQCSDMELLLFAGVLRTEYISEPAIATLIARELHMNDIIQSEYDQKTFCFDVYNAAMGFLHACQVASQLIQAGTFRTAMITASEVEVNAEFFEERLGLFETASAFILDESADGKTGFGQFVFKFFPQYFEARQATGWYKDGKPYCGWHLDDRLNDIYLECIPPAVQELLDLEGLDLAQIKVVLPSQFSSAFNLQLAHTLQVPADRIVEVDHRQKDLFTSSLPYALQHAQQNQQVQPGDIGLIINVASGVQVGCATYYF
ncbi:MAG: amino acid adenylation domain-containing protein, partial [Planctomycetales bacterium]|nr:amino acid adenylation domain-containing protein [Planctomycetales bacterium]NIM09548.1 amino acid adenylation domain-containing protein [Planctomycetales bacterium]NIN09036.1 amino acid adenylation domain-containing protein [Planctomycetales bacterium]NIN78149.1 amino acid adenylation domain-containing protein [Planctomycetales bacterium]NIO35334.1 amino acid adenylation domain-containing protein [Planctomycetales bacterium]